MYLQEDNAVVIHGHRVLQLDGSSFIVPGSSPDVWSHSLKAPEQHAGKRLLQNIDISVTHFPFLEMTLRVFSYVLCSCFWVPQLQLYPVAPEV